MCNNKVGLAILALERCKRERAKATPFAPSSLSSGVRYTQKNTITHHVGGNMTMYPVHGLETGIGIGSCVRQQRPSANRHGTVVC